MSEIQQSISSGAPPIPSDLPQQEIIAVPPPQMTSVPFEPQRKSGWIPAILVLALAFLLASSPVRNSDFWLHAATGKSMVLGHFQFGQEPFTGESNFWVNPSWLFDLMVYMIYQSLGGPFLVFLKCFVVGGMAWLLIVSGQSSKSLFLASMSAGLTLLAMAPWLVVLKPLCLSFFFLTFTIWHLEKRLVQGEKFSWLGSWWPLLVICLLWANLDSWFFLGPLTVGIYLLGSMLPGKKTAHDTRTLATLFVACVGVCLVNPHHVRILEIPFQMVSDGSTGTLMDDPDLRSGLAPFYGSFFTWQFLRNPPAWAFWCLAGLGLVSFVLDFRAPPWRWYLTWSFFFLLCLKDSQAIPFFAIVSGPILARNLGFFLSRPQAARYQRHLQRPGRAFAFLALAVLVIAAWPGWLQFGPHGPRSWDVELDPGIKKMGTQLATWRQHGKPQAVGTVFPFNPETGNYLAWLCPEVPCWINGHWHLSPKKAQEYVAVREGLMGIKSPGSPDLDWRAVLREGKVSSVVVHGNNRATILTKQNLYLADKECPLIAYAGKAAVFAWNDPLQGAHAGSGIRLALHKQAYSFADSPDENYALAEVFSGPSRWWEAYWRPSTAASLDRDEAATLLAFFDAALSVQAKKLFYLGQSKLFAEVAFSNTPGATTWNCLLQGHLALNAEMHTNMLSSFLRDKDDGPMDVLYLAVRACRRSLQKNPNDAQACFLLGQAYDRLNEHTRERNWGPVLGNFRTCQQLGAYQHVLKLDPWSWQAHERVGKIFRSMDYKDLALQHLREVYKIRSRGPAPGESSEQFKDRMGLLRNAIQKLEGEVQTLQDRWLVNSANLRIADRANLAGQYGLSGTALAMLLKSDIAAFGAKGLEMELKLLLNTGQLATVKSWLDPTKHPALLGNHSYPLIKAQLEAGLGNYGEAEDALENLVSGPVSPSGKNFRPIDLLATRIGNALLIEAAGGALKMLPLAADATPNMLPAHFAQGLSLMDRQALSQVMQGTLALEAGASKKAHGYFRRAANFWNSPAGPAVSDERSILGRQMASYFLHQLETANP